MKNYTVLPLNELDNARAIVKRTLRKVEAKTGDKYKIRTFYLGPRLGWQRNNTLKRMATGAKIGIYKAYRFESGFLHYELQGYV
jgi:hypothetical protein